jgi:biofilm PGA synthesis N-glycosyltransferase PgaC
LTGQTPGFLSEKNFMEPENIMTLIVPSLLAFLFWGSLLLIFYTYFGYPLLISLLPSRKKGNVTNQETGFPSVTLLIAAYNEEAVIEEKIRNSLDCEYPREKLQILIVTDGSQDKTPELVQKYAGQVELLHQPERRGKMAAINRAMQYVRGEIIVFSDANNLYQKDTLQKLAQPFSDPGIGAVTGAKVILKGDGDLGESEGLYWKYESFIKKQESRVGSCTSVAGEILAIRKSAYSRPPDNIINDDFFTAMQVIRQGYRLVYTPAARSAERVSPSARDEMIRRTRINAGRYQAIALSRQLLPFRQPLLIWQIFSHKFMRPLVPFFMITALLSNLAAVLLPYPGSRSWLLLAPPVGTAFLLLQALFYLLALVGTYLQKNQGGGRLRLLFYLPTFLTNSNLAALQGFFQFLKKQPGHLWQRINRR